ncbi:unnamed protein product, partial [Brassica oleracea]
INEGNDGFVRADQIDLKSIDEQLERHLSRALTLEKNKKRDEEESAASSSPVAALNGGFVGQRLEWEMDPSQLIIKTVLARGTFGTVHRGVYDGQDVAAVKLLDWGEEGHRSEAEIVSLRADFAQEVAVWHKLNHPNVTKFIGAIMGASGLQLQTESGPIAMPNNIYMLCCC